jgi:hypothetical protein
MSTAKALGWMRYDLAWLLCYRLLGLICIVISWREGKLDRDKLNVGPNRDVDPSSLQTAVTTG